jgi:DNA-binding NtrC family response regulator
MKPKSRILIVDDEQIVRESLRDWLISSGYDVETVSNGFEALDRIKNEKWDVLLTDLKMEGMDGIEVVREVKQIRKELPIVVITGYPTVDTAVQALKQGADDYIVKPFNPEEIDIIIKNMISRQNLIKENTYLRQELKRRYRFKDIIGKSHAMHEVMVLIKAVARSNSTVLIQGESGTGKELVARAIHFTSSRKANPFIAVSCIALPESLLEAELFGAEKGAFTGATSARKGNFEIAHKGTLFLDEISDMSAKTQANLLRVLEEREFRRVGGSNLIRVDIRVISATNRRLDRLVAEGTFREDLYYRLNVVTIPVPPLRERKEDIPLLVEHFMRKYSVENSKDIGFVDEEALSLLMDYDWPGNVRELENTVERAVVIAKKDFICREYLPLAVQKGATEMSRRLSESVPSGTGASTPRKETTQHELSLHEMEKMHISRVLELNGWNIKKAANALKIDRTTLYNKMKKYNLSKPV